MTFACTAATIVQLLGFMPAPGTTVAVPAHIVAQLSLAERSHARACARRFGLTWRVVER